MYTAGTNFPPHLYDGHLFGKESFYEELAKVQKTEMDKREKVADCIKFCIRRFVSGPWSEEEVGGKCQKSEFSAKKKQMGHPRGKQPTPSPNYLWPIIYLQMSRAGSGTGSAGTVISAFGSLNKKK